MAKGFISSFNMNLHSKIGLITLYSYAVFNIHLTTVNYIVCLKVVFLFHCVMVPNAHTPYPLAYYEHTGLPTKNNTAETTVGNFYCFFTLMIPYNCKLVSLNQPFNCYF